jgi:hypothetical protein
VHAYFNLILMPSAKLENSCVDCFALQHRMRKETPPKIVEAFPHMSALPSTLKVTLLTERGAFNNYVDQILNNFDHLSLLSVQYCNTGCWKDFFLRLNILKGNS